MLFTVFINVLTQYFDTHVHTDVAYVDPYLCPLEVVPTTLMALQFSWMVVKRDLIIVLGYVKESH